MRGVRNGRLSRRAQPGPSPGVQGARRASLRERGRSGTREFRLGRGVRRRSAGPRLLGPRTGNLRAAFATHSLSISSPPRRVGPRRAWRGALLSANSPQIPQNSPRRPLSNLRIEFVLPLPNHEHSPTHLGVEPRRRRRSTPASQSRRSRSHAAAEEGRAAVVRRPAHAWRTSTRRRAQAAERSTEAASSKAPRARV